MNKYILFYGNLYQCPAGPRLRSCPLYPLEHLSFEEKYIWFSNLPEQEKEALLNHHESCVRQMKLEKII